MAEQTSPKTDTDLNEVEDWVPEDLPEELEADSKIYKKNSVNPDKRRRLEALLEERELKKDLLDVFDDEYDDL